MASNDNPGPDEVEGSWSPRRPTSKATKRAAASPATSSPDPEVLTEEIEKTREELAETLDAIVEKVTPKKAVNRTKKKVGNAVQAGANDAVEAVKDTAVGAALTVKETAASAADSVKGGVAAVKEKVSGDADAPRSPLTPVTSVEVDSPSPVSSLPGAEVPVEPAPTPGALADAATTSFEPPGAETYTPTYPSTPPPSRLPVLAGAGAAAAVLLLLTRRRRRRRR